MIRTEKTKFGFLRTALAVGVAIPILAGAGAFAQAPAATPADSQITGAGAGAVGAGQTGSQPAAIGGGEFAAALRPKPSASS